jgi:hypothetical protein
MYFIDNPEELHGKTIAYVDMNQFAERIIIATTDGGILTVTQDADEFSTEIEVHSKTSTKYFILNARKVRKYILDDLIKYKVFTEEEYNQLVEEHNKEMRKQEKARMEKQKQTELEQYLKLKAKYENSEVK